MTRMRINMNLPPAECSPNVKCHPQVKGKAAAAYKSDCVVIARAEKGKWLAAKWSAFPIPKAKITLNFHNERLYMSSGGKRKIISDGLFRPRDYDNAIASAKHAIDALKEAGIILDDGPKFLTFGGVSITPPLKGTGRACLEIVLEWGQDAA